MKKNLVSVVLAIIMLFPVSSFAQDSYINISIKKIDNAPLQIKNAFLKYSENQLRAYFDVEYPVNKDINFFSVWLLLYYKGSEEPQLHKFSSGENFNPDALKNIVWDVADNGAKPLTGMIVPYYVDFTYEKDWHLRDHYKIDFTSKIETNLRGEADTPATPISTPDNGKNGNSISGEISSPANAPSMSTDTTAIPNAQWHREMNAVYITVPPKIDGKLDDEIWNAIPFHGEFIQRDPDEGQPASEKSEIALAYDEQNLYIAVRLYDSEPRKIRATEMRRDAFVFDDDFFEMVFDTFNDKRNGFYFTTNPLGIRIDGIMTDEGRSNNRDWDGVWSTESSIDKKGWYIETAIPWQTLRFKEGDDIVWGANFSRRVQRKNETSFWRLIPRSVSGRNAIYRVSQAGKINGLNGLKMGGNYEILPYSSGSYQKDDFVDDGNGDLGIDVKWNVSSTVTADFTYNTDFAQVEADQERVNLTRFSLFFPEKRDFFLEGAEIFSFGPSGGGFRPNAGDLQIYHSRQIGITSGQQIPILGGARIAGKIGDYSVGFLSIQTDSKIRTDDDNILETNYSVARVKRNLFSRSSIGLMYLNKEEMGSSYYNRTLGIDGNFPISESFNFFFAGAGTASPGKKSDNLGVVSGFNFNSDLWQYNAKYLDIQDDFDPELGFIRRTDIQRVDGEVKFRPRPSRWKSIRQFEYGLESSYQTNHNGTVLDKSFSAEFQTRFQSGANFNISIDREFEFIDEDWDVRDDRVVPAGNYYNTKYRVSYRSSRSRAVNGNITFNGGDFFTGTQIGGNFSGDIKLFNKFRGNVSYNYSNVRLPDGTFHTNTMSTRLTYSFNPDLFVKAFIQWYNDDLGLDNDYLQDNVIIDIDDRYSANIVLRYIYRPGSDFFLVYNQENIRGPNNSILNNRAVIAKFNYFFRK